MLTANIFNHLRGQLQLTGLQLVSVAIGIWALNAAWSWVRYYQVPKAKKTGSIPSTFPYQIPIVAHAISFVSDPPAFVHNVMRKWDYSPAFLNFAGVKFYMFFAPSDVLSLFAQSHIATNKAYRHLGTTAMFNMPQEAHEFIAADYTGKHTKPLELPLGYPDTKPKDRFEHLVHASLRKLLTGPGLKPFINKYEAQFPATLENTLKLDTKSSAKYPDLRYIIQTSMIATTSYCMFGPVLLDSTPGLLEDIVQHTRDSVHLAKGFPRWMIPAIHARKDRCVEGFKTYHAKIRSNGAAAEPTGNYTTWDKLTGTELVRSRQKSWKEMDPMTDDAQASEDFALMWAANHNATNSVFWLLTHILSDPDMKSRVDETLAQIEAEHGPNPGPYVLANSAYLQSLFSETLRLYSADTVLRGPSLRDTRIGNWVVPRGKFMGISSYGRHHDENYWNTGTEEKAHSLDEFWDERFLVSEKRNLRGPSKDPASSGAHSDAAMDAELSIGRVSDKDLKFSTDGLAGSYLPFGGGDTICPGRAFAKMEIISTVVYLLKNYEIELLAGRPKFNSGTFGIGVLSPEGTTPVMIKKM